MAEEIIQNLGLKGTFGMITTDHKRRSYKVRKADRGKAQDVQYQSARLHNRLVEETDERSDLRSLIVTAVVVNVCPS